MEVLCGIFLVANNFYLTGSATGIAHVIVAMLNKKGGFGDRLLFLGVTHSRRRRTARGRSRDTTNAGIGMSKKPCWLGIGMCAPATASCCVSNMGMHAEMVGSSSL